MSSSSVVSLLAVVVTLGYSFFRERAAQGLYDQVAELRTQIQLMNENNQLSTIEQSFGVQEKTRFLQADNPCKCNIPDGFTYAIAFGVIGDAVADDTLALQAAIDSASSNKSGGIVIIPKGTFRINKPLIVPAGITLQGMGFGDSPLAISFDAGASTIAYCGNDYAIKIVGHAASLRDLAIYDWPYTDCQDTQALGGVLVQGDASLVESVTVSNMLIYYFLGGPALSLVAKNSGGVSYGNYQNVRIRHAKAGISLSADDASFVNSNSFLAGGISGGGFEVGDHFSVLKQDCS